MSTTGGATAAYPSRASANYLLAALFVVYIFNYLDRKLLSLFLEPIKRELGASDTQMGILTGLSFAVFYSVAGLPLARWADSHSRTALITAGLVVWSAMTAVSGAARTYVQLLLARVGVGVGEASFLPSAHSLITNVFPPERRATAFAIFGVGASTGVVIGFIGGGLLYQQLGWRLTFAILGLAGIPLALAFRLSVREPARQLHEAWIPTREPVLEVARGLFSRRAFTCVAISISLHAVSTFGSAGWYAAFLMRIHQMSVLEVGTILGLGTGLGGALGQIAGGRIADRLSRRDVRWYVVLPAITSVLSFPLYAAFLWAWDTGSVVALYVTATVVGAAWVGPSWAMVQGLAPIRTRATASAIVSFLFNLIGMGLGPLAVGILSDALTPTLGSEALRYALLFIAIPHALAAIFGLIARGTLVQDLESAQCAG